jgi:hypothetical protein
MSTIITAKTQMLFSANDSVANPPLQPPKRLPSKGCCEIQHH